jgi:hypothetical protein
MFFFQMGTSSSQVPEGSPLACLLKCWKDIDPDNLCKKASIFFCIQAWPQYPLGDQEKWPEGRILNYNTILHLDLFCKREGKWTEIPYVQLFFFLKEHPQWVKQCKGGTQTLTMVCKTTPKEGDTSKTPPVTSKKATYPSPPKGSKKSGHPTPTACLPPFSVAVSC